MVIKNQYRKCPMCNEVIHKAAFGCEHCGKSFRNTWAFVWVTNLVVALLVGAMLWALISWQVGSFDDPPPPPPEVPSGGVRYEGQVYGLWDSRSLAGLSKALQGSGAFCPIYKYRKSLTYSDEYIVYCLMEYEGRMIAVDAYVVFPQVGTVVGPANPDARLE